MRVKLKQHMQSLTGGGVFDYRILTGEERDTEILNALKRCDEDKQVVATPERTQVWFNGWNENLQDFINSNYDLNSLKPKYFHPNITMKLRQQLIKSTNPNFQVDFIDVFRESIFRKYLADCENIYEFGCGTGQNLIMLADLFPNKNIYGFDFVQSSVDLINLIRDKKHCNISGQIFNMIEPDESLQIKPNSSVLTFTSIEQLGNQYQKFVKYLLKSKPNIVVNVEPMAEIYDTNNLIDYIAHRFHTKRNYPKGFIPLLKQLELEHKIEIIKIKRIYFGDRNQEGHNLMVWKPIN